MSGQGQFCNGRDNFRSPGWHLFTTYGIMGFDRLDGLPV